MADADESRRWRLVAEFLEDYRWEPPEARLALLSDAPAPTGDEHWDVFLAALAEHVAARDGRSAPAWTEERALLQFWFPFNTRSARTDAIVHAPAAFRRRGVYISPRNWRSRDRGGPTPRPRRHPGCLPTPRRETRPPGRSRGHLRDRRRRHDARVRRPPIHPGHRRRVPASRRGSRRSMGSRGRTRPPSLVAQRAGKLLHCSGRRPRTPPMSSITPACASPQRHPSISSP